MLQRDPEAEHGPDQINMTEDRKSCKPGQLAEPSDHNHHEGASDRPDDGERTTMPDTEEYSVFTKPQRIFIVFVASFAGFNSPLSGNIYVPAFNSIVSSLGVTVELVNLSVTTYMICQGLAPMLVGDFADTMGRRPAYMVAFTIYLGANIGLALQNNYAALLLLRCLQSSGSSGTFAMTYAVVADLSPPHQRGSYMGWASSTLMLGPAVGPILGGLLSQYLGWHSIFWFLAILAFCVLLVIVVCLPETNRNIVGNGSIPPPILNMSLISFLQKRRSSNLRGEDSDVTAATPRRKLRFPNPFRTIKIAMEKDVGLILLNNSLLYVAYFDLITSLPQLLGEIYGFSDLQIGLSFIPYGVGCAISSVVGGRLMDWNFNRIAKRQGYDPNQRGASELRGFPIEKARLQVAIPFLYAGTCSLIVYGWLYEFKVYYIAPLVLAFCVGLTINGSFSVSSTLLVDLYPQSPATASSANNLVRCLMGAAGTALISKMIGAMGPGWAFTTIALIIIAQSLSLFAVLKWGPKWREERYLRLSRASNVDRRGDAESGPTETESKNG